MSLLTWSVIPGALLVGACSDGIVLLLFGPAFAETSWVLTLHIWSALLVAQGVVQAQWFIIENRQSILAGAAVGAAAMNVGLNLWLVPTHGAAGAAVATLLSYGGGALLPAFHPSVRPIVGITLRAYSWPLRRLWRAVS
jgi:O-antigen/teichoic acid export membrane protein